MVWGPEYKPIERTLADAVIVAELILAAIEAHAVGPLSPKAEIYLTKQLERPSSPAHAALGVCQVQRLVHGPSSILLAQRAGNGSAILKSRPTPMPDPFLVRRARRSARWFDWAGERFRPNRLVTTACHSGDRG